MHIIPVLILLIFLLVLFYKIKNNYRLGTVHHTDIVHIIKGVKFIQG